MNTMLHANDFQWRCHRCHKDTALDNVFACPQCGEPRSLEYTEKPDTALFTQRPDSLWHYQPLLPVSTPVTLGEGATPLANAPALAEDLGFAELRIKNEAANPTGSFKDRQMAVAVAHAKEIGADTVTVVSSGNVASATAAYCAHAGLRAVLLLHGQAGGGKLAQATLYGATAIRVNSPSPKTVFDLCLQACAEWGWYHGSTAGMYEPYNVEGAKTIAYELYRQYNGDLPDWVVMPVGGGGLLGGVWRGLLDLKRLGLIETLPRLAGAQAAGCAPLEQSIENTWTFTEHLEHPWPEPDTVAGGIADDILFDGHTALPAIRETRGTAISATDPEIFAAVETLAQREGLLCELTSGAAFAALPKLPRPDHKPRVCCILTGSGLKDLTTLGDRAPEPPRAEPTLKALEKAVNS